MAFNTYINVICISDESPLSDSQSQFDEEFSKLSIESQKIVERINSMGFPKHLVVRVASKIQDDKKVSNKLWTFQITLFVFCFRLLNI